jgi:L-threonylcarbamoyladenylate synthase
MPVVAASPRAIQRAAEMLNAGGVVAFPTETVYGLGAAALNEAAVARIFEIKQRPSFDPLIVHVAGETMLERVAASLPPKARRLIERFWPGPLTLVVAKAPAVPRLVTAGLETVAVRMPAHPVARALLEAAGIPLAAPSANPFGRLSPTRAQHVAGMLGERVDLVLDGGPCEYGLESTIVALEPQPTLLRPGAVSVADLEAALGEPLQMPRPSDSIMAPGRVAHHYAPRTPLRIVDPQIVPAQERNRAALVTFSRRAAGYAQARRLSARGDLREAAARLFDVLHELDALGLERIDVEPFEERGLGVAIMDRLRRAATP